MTCPVVLVPGAWMGSWVWEDVATRLRELGFDVHTPTLAGLEGGADLSAIGLETHVAQVERLILDHDLTTVMLVGHSYSGLVVGQVADRQPARVAQTVFVQAFVPQDGRSLIDDWSPDPAERARETADIAAAGGRWAPPIAGLSAEPDLDANQRSWLARRFVDQPGRTVTDPARMSQAVEALPATYIASLPDDDLPVPANIQALVARPNWHLARIRAGHWPMVSAPAELTTLLAAAAARVMS